jgi:hypothetical protein
MLFQAACTRDERRIKDTRSFTFAVSAPGLPVQQRNLTEIPALLPQKMRYTSV